MKIKIELFEFIEESSYMHVFNFLSEFERFHYIYIYEYVSSYYL